MVHTEQGTRAHARAVDAVDSTRRAAPTPQAGSPDDKASPRRPPGAKAMAAAGDGVPQPWLRERKAQDLHAVLDTARAAALREPDFPSQCHVAYQVLEGIGEVTADPRGEQHLRRLLAEVLAFDEAPPRPAVLFAAWLRLVVTHIAEDGLVPFVLQALEAHPPRSEPALAAVAGHLALHALRELKDRPDLVFLHLGQVLSWLLRQDGPRRAEGLGGLGDGLRSSRHLSPRLLCEVLQAIAAARDEIRERHAGADVRAMLDNVAGAAGWRGIHAQGVLQALSGDRDAAAAAMPREEARATLRGLFDATLHPGLDPQALADGLVPWADLLAVPVLSAGDWVEAGRSIGANLGGADMAPDVLAGLVAGLAAQGGDASRSGAILRGLVLAMGGADIEDAPLAALARALSRTTGAGGWPLVLALADTLGALGASRAQDLPTLRERLERLLAAPGPVPLPTPLPSPASPPPPAPLPAPLRIGLSLASDPLGALLREDLPPADRLAGLEAAYAWPGLLDDMLVARQLWSCSLLAATDPVLTLQASRLLVLQAGTRITPGAFRELRAALLPQARAHQAALADLYGCFARHGRFDEDVPAAPAHKPGSRPASKPGHKAGGKAGWPQRQAATAHRAQAGAKFLREEAALIRRGLARLAFEPLALALEARAGELVPAIERKH